MKENFQHYYTDQTGPPQIIKAASLILKNGNSYSFKSPEGVFAFGKVDRASPAAHRELPSRGTGEPA